MENAWQKYLGANVPRYTSYPSALGFSEDIGAADYVEALGAIGLYEPVSLYLHIPFCKQLCWYCGCNMRVENKYERISRYVQALAQEIELVSGYLSGRGLVSQVHFGGGTPNTLNAADIEHLLCEVEGHFGLTDATPVAMEIDPRLCNEFQAAQLVRLGINRFSIGVQDFNPDVQAAINRPQSFELVKACMDTLRRDGIKDISLDLLYGLPNQTREGFARTVDQVISLLPERISLFGYTHMPSRFRHQQMIPSEAMPPREMRPVLAEEAAETLEAAGYLRIGFDHFALPHSPIARAAREHRLNRNFQGFTEDQAQNVLGFGTSAISTIHGLTVQNAKQIPDYLSAIEDEKLPIERGLLASAEEEHLGSWLKRLLCDMRANLRHYFDIVDASDDQYQRTMRALEPFRKDGIVSFEGDDIVISPEATALARSVAAALDPKVESQQQFASPAI